MSSACAYGRLLGLRTATLHSATNAACVPAPFLSADVHSMIVNNLYCILRPNTTLLDYTVHLT